VQDQELAKCAAKWQADICMIFKKTIVNLTSLVKRYESMRQMEVVRKEITKFVILWNLGYSEALV